MDWQGHEYVTASQAADYLSVHVRTVYRYALAGVLVAHRVAGSRSVRFRRADVERLLVRRDGGPDGEEVGRRD